MKKYMLQVLLSTIFAGGMVLAVGNPTFAAKEKDFGPACRDRLESARKKIDSDSAHNGEKSRQVLKDQDRLEQARRWCRDHHAEWDHDRFDGGVYAHH